MSKLYFAKHKETQKLYVGMKNNAGFTKIGDLKRSITYKCQYYRSSKSVEDYNIYYLDIDNMSVHHIDETK